MSNTSKKNITQILQAIEIKSGEKYRTPQGFSAIKDGIKATESQSNVLKKPTWLKISLKNSPKFQAVKALTQKHQLATVCEEAKCPNINECWSHGTATIMLMGAVCTRACKFCAVDTGNPKQWLDLKEPEKTADTVHKMGLQYVVLTSVDRDDLPDGGAQHYADTIRAIKQLCPLTKVEALTPDFNGSTQAADCIIQSGVDVFAQNVETVERLTQAVRDPRAGYWQTINFLAYIKKTAPQIFTKSSLMLGMGETTQEIEKTMDDLRAAGVDILTLGQYLQPTRHHYPVNAYIPPEDFQRYRDIGLQKGFYEVASGPMVRSSYRADRVFSKQIED